ncbi:conserved hypothetical protein [delta proteobacterium NaphS2]|nr:conserved hypothetical protein [delta proteobacterium NaphS2]
MNPFLEELMKQNRRISAREIEEAIKNFRCDHCAHWILDLGKRMAWGTCQIDKLPHKWTANCLHPDKFRIGGLHAVNRRRRR